MFITHGGAGGLQETICHRTPVLGIPIMNDQKSNLFVAETKGFGLVVDWSDLTEANLLEAVTRMMEDDSYQSAVDHLRDLVLDQPLHPLEAVTWWMEYLLRHPHNTGMTPPAHELWWFQYFLLDVAAVILLACLSMFYVSRALYRCCARTKIKKD